MTERPWEHQPDDESSEADPKSNKSNFWLILGGIVFVLFIISSVVNGDGDSDGGGSSAGAKGVCETHIKARLKSPGSAKFNHVTATPSGGEWSVTGSVDSDNSFGASIRNTYTCILSGGGSTDYRLVDLHMSEN